MNIGSLKLLYYVLAVVSGVSESGDGVHEEETEGDVDETITGHGLEQDFDDKIQPTMVRQDSMPTVLPMGMDSWARLLMDDYQYLMIQQVSIRLGLHDYLQVIVLEV